MSLEHKMKYIILAILIASVVSGSTIPKSGTSAVSKSTIPKSGDSESDTYIDLVIERLRTLIAENNLDPMPLPPGEVSFSDTIVGITFHGSANVFNGKFSGLSSIARSGDTSLAYDPSANKATLTAYIGMTNADAGYDAKAEFMGIEVGASADANIKNVQVYFEAEMCLTDGCTLQLTIFEIIDIGDIDVHFDGLGPLDWIIGKVVGFVANLIEGTLRDVLEGPIRDLLQNALDDLNPSHLY